MRSDRGVNRVILLCPNPPSGHLYSITVVDAVAEELPFPDDTFDAVVQRRNVEGGGRRDDIRHTSYRGVVGLKGDLFDDKWTYDVFGQYGTVVYQETYQNDFSIARSMTSCSDRNSSGLISDGIPGG